MYLVCSAMQSQVFWTAVAAVFTAASAVALIVTLIWVSKYTKSTADMAAATKSMAEAQMAVTELQRNQS